jgi:ATP-dependent helicase/DNAse subunit B
MAAILMIGAAGQGKTQAAIQHIRALQRRRLFGKVWVLLPSDLQIQAFRARLLEGIGEPAYFGVEFFEFYALYARLLEIAGTPQRQVQDAARFRILRHVLTEALEAPRLQHFSAIAETPGFVRLVADLIQELKQARIGPEQFAALAHTPKDHDLALIYTEYQNFLRERGLVDRDGEGWLALALLEQRPDLNLGADLLIVDGYDQFNIVQAQLLGLLAARLPETLLTLTYQPDRAETAHRRYAQTRTRLLEQSPSGVWTEKSAIQQPVAGSQPSATLAALSENLFEAQQASLRIENDGSLRLVEAPDRRREVQTVLRQVKRLLLAGVAPEQIAVLVRNLEPYSPYFLENAPAYGIPITTRQGSPLKENPAIATLLALIDLAEEGFRRQAVIDLLNSAYLAFPDLTPEQVDALDRLSREQAVVRRRAAWLEAIDAAGKHRPDEDEDALSPEEQAALGANLAALRAGLESFFQRVTPPPKGTARDYVHWLESIIGPDPKRRYEPADLEELITPTEKHFRMIPRIRAEGDLSADPAIIGRDLTAMLCLKRVFRDLLAAYELVDGPR